MNKKQELKIKLHQKCAAIALGRIESLRKIISDAQDAANNETKSSAGDKHETGRAMAQLETEKLSVQLLEALKLKQGLDQINPEIITDSVVLGSVVITDKTNYYLSVSIGKIEVDGNIYFAISPLSPIGKLILGKKKKDIFEFNNSFFNINSIF